jgi:nucleotide-binding universal stress UspA family protein
MHATRKILVPVDFSSSSQAAFARGAQLARGAGATLEVLHVYEPSAFIGPDSLIVMPVNLAQKWELTRAQIRRELESFLGPDHGAASLMVEIGTAADVIPTVAQAGAFDLIVMGAHGGAGLSRVVGKVTEAVMRKAHCQVVTVHLPERVAREAVPM